MSAAKKIILLLWFIVASLATASALTPGATETRVGQKSFAPLESRQAQPLQTAGRHQRNAGCGYELAPESLLAAKTATPRNPNVYEALFEAPITGTTRAAHRTSANQFLANQLGNDAQLSGMFNQQFGGNVLQHMQSGRSGLLNPPGAVWHHPANNPNVMQLLMRSEHTAPSLQPVLHPGGVGGFGNFYGP